MDSTGWTDQMIGTTLYRCTIMLTVVLACGNLQAAQPEEPANLEHFRFERSIKFTDPHSVHSDTLLIGHIWSLEVGADGRLLVVDMRGQQAFLFDQKGRMLAPLDPSVCHPGFEVRPVHGIFIGDQSILLSNAGPWGYRFTTDGDCLGNIDPDFSLTSAGFLSAGHHDLLHGLSRGAGKAVVQAMDTRGKLLREIPLPSISHPNISRRIATGGLIADNTNLFYTGPVDPHILRLSLDGKVITRISHRTSWFRDASADLPDLNQNDPMALVQAVGRVFRSTTLTDALFELTAETILAQYINPGAERGYQIFTKQGRLVAQELGIEILFNAARDGLAYHVVQPGLDDSGELPNPFIEVYRFITPP
ncbi:MAG: hypothetical protein OXU68_00695 [Bacteroidota bacterium]|nr:hypothetical protein [Bacteroidota bacterium]